MCENTLTVYLDVIWLLNLLFDTLLLYLTAIFLKRSVPIWRLFAGGFIGSLIIIFSFTPLSPFSNHPISKLICSMLMILAVFGFKRLRFYVRALLTLYLSTFLIGGALIGAHYFIQFDRNLTTSVLLSNVQGFGDPISWLFIVVGFPIAWHFSKVELENMEMTKIQYDQIVSVTVRIDTEKFDFKGLIDSGNQVYDPLSKMPVMFVTVKNIFNDIPEPIQRMALLPEQVIVEDDLMPIEWKERIRVVPCRVVGQEHQLMVAIKPDMIVIKKGDDLYQCEKGLISFTMQQLSAEDAFQCIVHPKMLTGIKQRCDEVNAG
jgi:stage II sporulation protein GA (sporulation sigma-E factor processing peptidase)